MRLKLFLVNSEPVVAENRWNAIKKFKGIDKKQSIPEHEKRSFRVIEINNVDGYKIYPVGDNVVDVIDDLVGEYYNVV